MTAPLAIDLFCGLGGWTESLLAEGYYVVGFDITRHVYGEMRYPAQLVIQDVLTLHGSQFKDAALIVASPPCQAYSYRAMPWKRAKALPPPDNSLFEACFRIQREACEAAGRHIPLIVENVRGAEKWVGRARGRYGSFYLWGDVPALMPTTFKGVKVPMPRGGDSLKLGFQQTAKLQMQDGFKTSGMNWSDRSKRGQDFTRIAGNQAMNGIKCGGDWFGPGEKSEMRKHHSKSPARKMAERSSIPSAAPAQPAWSPIATGATPSSSNSIRNMPPWRSAALKAMPACLLKSRPSHEYTSPRAHGCHARVSPTIRIILVNANHPHHTVCPQVQVDEHSAHH